MKIEHPKMMDTKRAADCLGVKPQTLRVWRLKGGGPRYAKYGDSQSARVFYSEEDLRKWLEDHFLNSTSEKDARDE